MWRLRLAGRGWLRGGCGWRGGLVAGRLRLAGGIGNGSVVHPGHNLRAFAFGKDAQNVSGLRHLKAGS